MIGSKATLIHEEGMIGPQEQIQGKGKSITEGTTGRQQTYLTVGPTQKCKTPQKWFDQREEADSMQKFEEKDKGDRTVGVTQGGATQV